MMNVMLCCVELSTSHLIPTTNIYLVQVIAIALLLILSYIAEWNDPLPPGKTIQMLLLITECKIEILLGFFPCLQGMFPSICDRHQCLGYKFYNERDTYRLTPRNKIRRHFSTLGP